MAIVSVMVEGSVLDIETSSTAAKRVPTSKSTNSFSKYIIGIFALGVAVICVGLSVSTFVKFEESFNAKENSKLARKLLLKKNAMEVHERNLEVNRRKLTGSKGGRKPLEETYNPTPSHWKETYNPTPVQLHPTPAPVEVRVSDNYYLSIFVVIQPCYSPS